MQHGKETWEKEIITPELAQKYLDKMAPNRSLSQATVEQYATCILNNDFSLTHEGIAFDRQGFLIDGQHRMHAILRANKPLTQWVCRGLPRDAMRVVNSGRIRTQGQVAKFHGVKNANVVMGTCRSAMAGLSYPMSDVPRLAALECCIKHEDDVHWVIHTCKSTLKLSAVLGAIMRASLSIGRSKLSYFLESIADNTFTTPYAPGNLLVRTFAKGNRGIGNKSSDNRHAIAYGKTVTAIKMYMDGEEGSALKIARADLWMPDFHKEFIGKVPTKVDAAFPL